MRDIDEKNWELRRLLKDTYFKDPVERLVYNLFLHYAFVLHEHVENITDEEIERARRFARQYITIHKRLPHDIDEACEIFVNREKFTKMTGLQYEDVIDEIKQKYESKYGSVDDLKIYYSVDNNSVVITDYDDRYIYDLDHKILKIHTQKIDEELELMGIFNVERKISI